MTRESLCSLPLLVAATLWFATWPAPAHANVIWPGLVVGWATLFWAVPAGLLIEYLAVQKWLPMVTEPGKAVIMANLISGLAGIILFPILASFGEIVPKTVLRPPAEWSAAWDRSYHLLTLLGLIPLAALASTLIEGQVMHRRFGLDQSGRTLKILFFANLVSTSVAAFFAALFM
jgi:hypothetical protein